jgi:hypothetical protein
MNTRIRAIIMASVVCTLCPFVAGAQIKDSMLMVIGAGGHSISQIPYNQKPHKEEFDLLKSIGLTCYRSPEFGGIGDAARFTEFCDQSFRAGIEELVIINPDPLKYAGGKEAYEFGFKLGKDAAATLKKHHIKYYDAGNEYDNRCILHDNNSAADYDSLRFAKCSEMQRGIIEGVHASDPKAKVVLQSRPSYLKCAWDAGLRWDISGIHEYDKDILTCYNGEVKNIHEWFGKPIWITEFNGWSNKLSEVQMAEWLMTNFNKWKPVAAEYNIQRVFLYELYDQDSYDPPENKQGICKSNGAFKPSADSLKAWIARNPPFHQ